MPLPIKHGSCKRCSNTFDKLWPHQKFCTLHCAFLHNLPPFNPNSNKCWEWSGGGHQLGYGEIGYNGIVLRAHRVSYQLHYGYIPENAHILHHCDNPKCVRPTHLYAGTHQANMVDMSNRYRNLQKLTPEKIAQIEVRIKTGEPLLRIAKDFNVSQPTINRRKQVMIREGRLPN